MNPSNTKENCIEAGDLFSNPWNEEKNALLVYPHFPLTYWGLQHALRLVGKNAALPPLGLITLAALLPSRWNIRLVDLNVESLRNSDLEWADLVLTGGMLIQEESIHEIIAEAHLFHLPAIVGGPAATSSPDKFSDADLVFRGEAENRVDELVRALSDLPEGRMVLDAPSDYPNMADAPSPRFDLLNLSKYASISMQFSRGCPYQCEFCDIVELFGHTPRLKTKQQILIEMESIFQLGYRGTVFFVDDNFIGNKKSVKSLLSAVSEWQGTHGRPFEFYTEADIGLAADSKLLESMVGAGFTSVFVGIETPSIDALEQAKKIQNLKLDLSDAVDKITRAGLEVMGGFIVGFDTDDEDVFALQRDFLSRQPIPLAMVGILMALPGTALWRRLESEGRLIKAPTGDQFSPTNFVPQMDVLALMKGYARLLAELYSPRAYYRRCRTYLRRSRPHTQARPSTAAEIGALLRTIWHVGIVSSRRFHFWRLLLNALPRGRDRIRQAVVHALQGEHLIRYTREYVLPRLERAIAGIPIEERRYSGVSD